MGEDPPYRSIFIGASDGLLLHAREYGPRPAELAPVICLPGLARTAADFHELALTLSSDAKRPRRVIAVDYRGRGLSGRDPDWRNYDIRVELDDLAQVLTALDVTHGCFVGTSRGGLLTMALAAVRPSVVVAAVLNDIGPIIDAKGLIRIRNYVGKLPTPANFEEAVGILKLLFDAQFPALGHADWERLARSSWHEENGRLTPVYDPALVKTLEAIDLEAPLPELWPHFECLKRVPVLAIRGENSDILSAETLAAMTERHPALEAITIPGQGHAPLTTDPLVIKTIVKFINRVAPRGFSPLP